MIDNRHWYALVKKKRYHSLYGYIKKSTFNISYSEVLKQNCNHQSGVYQYLNIREYDVEETDLLKYWDKTYLFIKVIRQNLPFIKVIRQNPPFH